MSDERLFSLRELIHELATIEDAARGGCAAAADPRRGGPPQTETARQEAIIEELRRRSLASRFSAGTHS